MMQPDPWVPSGTEDTRRLIDVKYFVIQSAPVLQSLWTKAGVWGAIARWSAEAMHPPEAGQPKSAPRRVELPPFWVGEPHSRSLAASMMSSHGEDWHAKGGSFPPKAARKCTFSLRCSRSETYSVL